jgi:hypothetical protein
MRDLWGRTLERSIPIETTPEECSPDSGGSGCSPGVIELRTAYEWTCDKCGRDNFARAVVPESLEGLLPDDLDPEDFEGGEWVMKPGTVTCRHCGTTYETEE